MVRLVFNGISLPERESPTVETLCVTGDDERDAEKVIMHARAEAVRAMIALESGRHPSEVETDELPTTVDWDRLFIDPNKGGD